MLVFSFTLLILLELYFICDATTLHATHTHTDALWRDSKTRSLIGSTEVSGRATDKVCTFTYEYIAPRAAIHLSAVFPSYFHFKKALSYYSRQERPHVVVIVSVSGGWFSFARALHHRCLSFGSQH